MKKPVCERRVPRVLMIFVVTLLVVSGAGAFETGVIVRGEDESLPAGQEVFGTTVSKDGGALAGVRVSLSGDGVDQKTVSDADGAFRFTLIPPGSYTMVFKIKGAKKAKREITVSTGDVDTGKITMR
jgi:hypothetical protein